MTDFDDLVALEEDLIVKLSPTSKVDGHDCGVGEFNIFVLTNEPREAFRAAKSRILERGLNVQFRAAYRGIAEDKYIILWPDNLQNFRVA